MTMTSFRDERATGAIAGVNSGGLESSTRLRLRVRDSKSSTGSKSDLLRRLEREGAEAWASRVAS